MLKGRSKRSRTSQNFEDFDENSRKSFPLGPQESPKTNNELVSKLEPPPGKFIITRHSRARYKSTVNRVAELKIY